MMRWRLLGLVGLSFAACSPAVTGPIDAGQPEVDAGHQPGPALRACAGVLAEPPSSIASVVKRLDSLPRPTTPACLVASLPRPLELVATTSVLSAQPAAGSDSPRVFLLLPGLVLSVVAASAGANLLELGQWESSTRTLKGELLFPLEAALAPGAPFDRVASQTGVTTCAVCHRDELPHGSVDGGYVSVAYRPDPGLEVKLGELAALHQGCVDSADLSPRCELFHALFDFGSLKQGAFAREVALFIP